MPWKSDYRDDPVSLQNLEALLAKGLVANTLGSYLVAIGQPDNLEVHIAQSEQLEKSAGIVLLAR